MVSGCEYTYFFTSSESQSKVYQFYICIIGLLHCFNKVFSTSAASDLVQSQIPIFLSDIMEKALVLYCSSTSFFSQRARLCLTEKALQFKHFTLDIAAGETYEPWYMKMNPKGQVPVLQHGDRYIADSMAIIKYVDDNFANTPRFTPDVKTQQGALVHKVFELCNRVVIPRLTFAVQFFPDKVQDSLLSEAAQAGMRKRVRMADKLAEEFVKKAEKYPELREAYLEKQNYTSFLQQMEKDPNQGQLIDEEIEKCRTVFDEVETLLQKKQNDGQKHSWLCSEDFSLADVEVGLLMQRLRRTGVAKATWKNGNYPNVEKYFEKICGRKSFQECTF